MNEISRALSSCLWEKEAEEAKKIIVARRE